MVDSLSKRYKIGYHDIICLIGINGGIGGTNPINSYGVPFCFCF